MAEPRYETRTVYDVAYSNEFGDMGIRADFDLDQATRMAAQLFGDSAWGKVASVTITKASRRVDARSIEEVEENVFP